MKFKFKPKQNTTYSDVRIDLENLKKATINEIPLNHLRKICRFIGVEEIKATGSSVRFTHRTLEQHPYYRGFFQIHKIHKGGDQELVRKNDYKKYFYPAVLVILDTLENE